MAGIWNSESDELYGTEEVTNLLNLHVILSHLLL